MTNIHACLCRYSSNEWQADLKKVLKRTGLEGKHTVFLFTDTQIVQENFLEVSTFIVKPDGHVTYAPEVHRVSGHVVFIQPLLSMLFV